MNSDGHILKNVIKDVVAKGYRSRNLMLFGLKEEKGDLLCDKVNLAKSQKKKLAESVLTNPGMKNKWLIDLLR